MNFLSHFYFDQHHSDPNVIIGTLLPDLLKNAHKNWNPHPQKNEALFENDAALKSLLYGWKRHLEVDIIFHSSNFFLEKTAELKKLLLPILKESVVRPSFLAHIGVELLLDHLLIQHQKIHINSFYENLEKVKLGDLNEFLKKCEIDDVELFFKFFNSFKASKYLLSYQKLENISYALQRICMRLWEHPFTEAAIYELTAVLEFYKIQLEVDFIAIFEEIEHRLT
jgi:acyl carrier protein phosphodiesterase